MTNITNLILRSNYLARQIGRMEQILKASPEGKLYLKKRSSGIPFYTKYEQTQDGTLQETYLSPQHPEFTALANKRYAELALKDLYPEKKLVDKAIALYQRGSRLDEFIKAHPELMNLISPGLRPLNQLAREWMEKPYERNNKYPEDLRFSTVVPNLYVRSKAVDVADATVQIGARKIAERYGNRTNDNINRILNHEQLSICRNRA